MKCIACGKDNVQDARFCAFCGAGMPVQEPVAEEKPQTDMPAARQTARPLSDNPYQPPRAPVIPSANPAAKTAAQPAAPVVQESDSPAPESAAHKPLIKPSPKRVFLYEEEEEEERRRAAEAAKKNGRRRKADDEEDDPFDGDLYDEDSDEFDEFEYDDSEDDDDPYEDDGPSAGRIFVRVFSVLTVLILIVGVGAANLARLHIHIVHGEQVSGQFERLCRLDRHGEYVVILRVGEVIDILHVADGQQRPFVFID